MTIVELARLIKEIGISAAAFGLCAYLTIFIVKRLAISVDELCLHIKTFATRVREEHDRSGKEHEALMKQHDEMIKTLGRINGYKE